MQKKWPLWYMLIFCTGIFLIFGVYQKGQKDYQSALEAYKKESYYNADAAAKKIEDSFRHIYKDLRTIGLLTGVRRIDRHGKNLDEVGRQAIQQIYNRLVTDVAIHEVYIVPVDFNPDEIDPVTKKLQEPILMFDKPVYGFGLPLAIETRNHLEEVEIYEYRLLREQMGWLKEHYPDTSGFKNLDFPFIAGPEVITCDNREYKKTLLDKDRKGLALSVPFYGEDGMLHGTVMAIIRTNIIKAMLPEQDFALVNPVYNYVATAKEAGQETASANWVVLAKPDPALLFSAVIRIQTNDPRSTWSLWAGYPDKNFIDGAAIRKTQLFKYGGYIFSLLLTAIGLILMRAFQCECVTSKHLKDNNAILATSNAALDEFAHIVSHDIKEPLRGMQSFSRILLEDYEDKLDADGKSMLSTISVLAKRLDENMNALLYYSRLEKTEESFHETDLEDVVRDTIGTLSISLKEKNTTVEICQRLPVIVCDRVKVAEVFLNLIGNAIKYNDKPANRIEIGMLTDHPRAPGETVFYVRDHGIGIAEKYLEAIFKMFKRLHPREAYGGGTGSGLAIARKIVIQHGGEIWAESKGGGQGTTFFFTLPQQKKHI